MAGDENRANDTAETDLVVLYPERHDVGATAILAPAGTIDSGTVVVPSAVVCNFGTRAETFPVTFTIGLEYTRTTTTTLEVGETRTLLFPDWVAQPVGAYVPTAYTELGPDLNRANDTVYGADTLSRGDTIFVIYPDRHDVGLTVILAPVGTLDSGSAVTPRVVAQNYGTRDETFPVTLAVGPEYSETISAALLTGQSDTLSFPVWYAAPVGSLDAVCYTRLGTDYNRVNDTARTAVDVIYFSDIGVSAVLAPTGEVELEECFLVADPVVPRCRVTNYGQQAESNFRVMLRIDSLDTRGDTSVAGTVWTQSIEVATALAPGASVEFTFDSVALPLADFAVRCSTVLVTDRQAANDAAQEPFRVAAYTWSAGEGDFSAYIYTRAGERVRYVKNRIYGGDPLVVQWDGTNDRGHPVAPGVYLCLMRFEPKGGNAQEQVTKILVTPKIVNQVLHWRKP
jgi:hypothetical protein